jgi:hypothetical protein
MQANKNYGSIRTNIKQAPNSNRVQFCFHSPQAVIHITKTFAIRQSGKTFTKELIKAYTLKDTMTMFAMLNEASILTQWHR